MCISLEIFYLGLLSLHPSGWFLRLFRVNPFFSLPPPRGVWEGGVEEGRDLFFVVYIFFLSLWDWENSIKKVGHCLWYLKCVVCVCVAPLVLLCADYEFLRYSFVFGIYLFDIPFLGNAAAAAAAAAAAVATVVVSGDWHRPNPIHLIILIKSLKNLFHLTEKTSLFSKWIKKRESKYSVDWIKSAGDASAANRWRWRRPDAPPIWLPAHFPHWCASSPITAPLHQDNWVDRDNRIKNKKMNLIKSSERRHRRRRRRRRCGTAAAVVPARTWIPFRIIVKVIDIWRVGNRFLRVCVCV